MDKSADDIIKIIKAGGGVSLPRTKMTEITEDLILMAEYAADAGVPLILKNVKQSRDECIEIAKAGKGRVIFHFD